MKTRRSHTGFGLFDNARSIARRVREEWDRAENQPPPPRPFGGAAIIEFPLPDPNVPKEKRPLAA